MKNFTQSQIVDDVEIVATCRAGLILSLLVVPADGQMGRWADGQMDR